jgi:hypothetical protein
MAAQQAYLVTSKEKLANEYWRLNNLYYIKDKKGKKVKFKFNWAQEILYRNMWFLNIILKARQLGLTTFIQIFMLDRCLFNSNINAGVIAHNRDDAQKFFKDKIKFAYDNLPDQIKKHKSAANDSAGELSFSNGSSIRVGSSLRSGTYQYLHISELGKVCAKFPDKAEEIKTGALNTVEVGQFIFIESTAEGDYGDYYDLCKQYENASKDDLTKLDYLFFFFSWWRHPDYTLDDPVDIPLDLEAYFADLKLKHDIELTDGQKAWYVKKKITQKNKMKQEYPSTPDEAFEQISEYAVYGKEIGEVIESNRYISLPIDGGRPVDIFWDIGKSKKTPTTAAWLMQDNEPWFDFVDYYEESLKTVAAYVSDIRSLGHNIGRWFIPHDGESQTDYDLKTFKKRLVEAGVPEDDIVTVARIDRLETGIDMMKAVFPKCRFNKDKVGSGWKALKAYKYSWDDRKAVMGQPVHDWASHPSDSIRQFAQGYVKADNDDHWSDPLPPRRRSVA